MVVSIDVQKRLGDFLVHASFDANGSSVVGLFGRSGAGKTSVINMVAGLIRPDQGRIVVKGDCVFDSDRGINLPPHKRGFGYIFQDGRLFPHMSVRSNLAYGMKLVPRAKRRVRMDQVLKLLGITHLLERHPANLSGGEKQRVAIGRALLTSPGLLLMDEPLASLDEARKTEVLPFIGRLPEEFHIPILYVSHSMSEMRSIADKIVFMEAGRVTGEGGIETPEPASHVGERNRD
jgi:molybdate transport system ATP-binding protein